MHYGGPEDARVRGSVTPLLVTSGDIAAWSQRWRRVSRWLGDCLPQEVRERVVRTVVVHFAGPPLIYDVPYLGPLRKRERSAEVGTLVSKLIAHHPIAVALVGAVALFAVAVVLAFAAGYASGSRTGAVRVAHFRNSHPHDVASKPPHFRNL